MARCEFGPRPRAAGEGPSRPPGWEGRLGLQSPAGEGRASITEGPDPGRLKEGSVEMWREEKLTLVCISRYSGPQLGHKEKGWEADG